MRSSPSGLRVGAVVLAVALGGSYVWFRTAQAGGGGDAAGALPGSKGGIVDTSTVAATRPTTTTAPSEVPKMFPGSKSAAVFVPAATAAPTTAPTAEQFRVIYSSKSAPVKLLPTTAQSPGN